jgi:hypothetical protein
MRPTQILSMMPTVLLSIVSVTGASIAVAQDAPELPAPSPRARVEQRVGLTDFAVEYSSPGVKGRKIWGELVPYDELWRTGANRSTKFVASGPFSFAGTQVPAGEYSLFTIPGKKRWTVVLNGKSDLPGTRGYDEAADVARVTVESASAPARERMTFLFASTTDDATRLDLEWAGRRVSIPIEVDTASQVAANIDAALDEAWRPHFASARWLLENGGKLDTALAYANTSIAIRPTWWNTWWKAKILAEQGKTGEAVGVATEAQKLGAGDDVYEGFFAEQVQQSITDWK